MSAAPKEPAVAGTTAGTADSDQDKDIRHPLVSCVAER
jgi:hypothetical protein